MKTDPTAPRILALGAHPDDLEFGMGGVLLNEFDAGAEIFLVLTSQGEAASHGSPAQRQSEAQAAAELLGAAERLQVLDFGGDGQQTASPANATQIARLIREQKPSLVFAPIPSPNQHPDHAAVGQATRDACRLARYGGLPALKSTPAHVVDSLWFYAVTPLPDLDLSGAVLIDVSTVLERWKTLMACHASQTASRRYLDLQISRARQLGLLAGCEYATPLWPNDPPVLASLQPLARTARGF
jgi:N-acetylglucosamine malate deacetylase 1